MDANDCDPVNGAIHVGRILPGAAIVVAHLTGEPCHFDFERQESGAIGIEEIGHPVDLVSVGAMNEPLRR
jgi:hypothetical protein